MMVPKSWRVIAACLIAHVFIFKFCVAETATSYSFMDDATEAALSSSYDYIVVGGGTTGIPLAVTLSEKYSVLLLERGGSPYGNPNITDILNYGSYFFDTSPDSPSQQFMADGVVNQRARVLGGGTSINAGFYSRGDETFCQEARLADEDLVQESYQWVENIMVSKPVVRQWKSTLRAALVEVGVKPDNDFTYDHVIGTKVGGTIFDVNGKRRSAADMLQYANPNGMSVLLHATVQKILFKTKGKSRPLAYGVEFQDSLGKKHVAYLKGGEMDEIILSAGAIGSPQLLMLSGIGPRKLLDALSIKVVLPNRFVGKGMADNPLNAIFVPSPIAVEPSIVQVVGITQFGSYIESSGGFNFIFADLSDYQGFSPKKGGFIFEKINGPLSLGELNIENSDATENPSVIFNYFKDSQDLQKCVKGVGTILKAIESKAFSKYKYATMTVQDILDLNVKLQGNKVVLANTNSSLEEYCKGTVRTIGHYHGGCHIGLVVDHEYKVIGADALRVIDGSTIQNSPGTNPQASLLMLGRYMGVTILVERLTLDKSNKD